MHIYSITVTVILLVCAGKVIEVLIEVFEFLYPVLGVRPRKSPLVLDPK